MRVISGEELGTLYKKKLSGSTWGIQPLTLITFCERTLNGKQIYNKLRSLHQSLQMKQETKNEWPASFLGVNDTADLFETTKLSQEMKSPSSHGINFCCSENK